MLNRRNTLLFLREFSDMFILNFCLFGSLWLSHNSIQIINKYSYVFLLANILWMLSSKDLKVYDDFRSRNFSYEIIPFLKSVLIQAIGLIVILFVLKYTVPRIVVVYFLGLFISLCLLEKYLLRKLLNYYRKKGRNLRNLLIIGTGNTGKHFYDIINNNPHFGYNILGFLDDVKPSWMNGEYIGPIKELYNILSDIQIDNVIVALPNYAYKKVEDIIAICEKFTTRVKIIPDYYQYSSGKYSVSMFGEYPVVSVHDDHINEIQCRILKRAFDIFFSTIVIVSICSWLMPLIGLGIKLSSPGPIIFKQERWGRDNKKFFMYKFRTMICSSTDVDSKGKYQQAKKNDSRITKLGKILRKTNLDEMPQFINVFLGDMSVVGPRPHPTPLNLESKENIKQYMLRHLVKPGITGWAQINGLRGETKDKKIMQNRVKYDVWYIENWSFFLDIQIIFLTAWRTMNGDPNAY